MKYYVKSATYVKYNANNNARDTGDCVVRAMSLAFNKSYKEMHKLLTSKANDIGYSYKRQIVWGQLIESLDPHVQIDRLDANHRYTVEEYADEYLQHGTYLLLVSEESLRSNHMVCVIDGKIYDSWDSRNNYVDVVYTLSNSVNLSVDSIADNFDEFIASGEEQIHSLSKKYCTKWSLGESTTEIKSTATSDYQINYTIKIDLPDHGVFLRFTIPIVFSPTMTLDEAHTYHSSVLKQKLYDKMYALREKLKTRSLLRSEPGQPTENFEADLDAAIVDVKQFIIDRFVSIATKRFKLIDSETDPGIEVEFSHTSTQPRANYSAANFYFSSYIFGEFLDSHFLSLVIPNSMTYDAIVEYMKRNFKEKVADMARAAIQRYSQTYLSY